MGLKALLEPQWKKVYTKRMKKTGMSECLRNIDKFMLGEYIKNGGSQKFVEKVTGPGSCKSDDERFLKGFKNNKAKIEKIFKGKKDWKDAEKKLLTQILKDFDDEIKFWSTSPCQQFVKDNPEKFQK